MRTLLRSLIIVGYLLFGYFWLQAGFNILTKNVFFDLYTLESTKPSEFNYSINPIDDREYLLKYQYKVGSKTYKNELKANKSSFIQKVGLNKRKTEIIYNKQLPSISYIKEWNLFLFYKFTFVLFSSFLGLMYFGHRLLIEDSKNKYYK